MKQIAFTGIIETGNNSDMFYMSLRLIFCPFSMFKKLARQLGCCVLVVFTNIKTYVTTGSQNPSLTQPRNKTTAKQMHKYRRYLKTLAKFGYWLQHTICHIVNSEKHLSQNDYPEY